MAAQQTAQQLIAAFSNACRSATAAGDLGSYRLADAYRGQLARLGVSVAPCAQLAAARPYRNGVSLPLPASGEADPAAGALVELPGAAPGVRWGWAVFIGAVAVLVLLFGGKKL